jgi:hypothetical protein
MSLNGLKGRTLTIPSGCWRGFGGSHRGVARFSFAELCGQNLGSTDYSALAAEFSIVIVDQIPVMDFETRAYARRFITLVDELYNRRVRLICSAAVDIDGLFDDVSMYDASHDLENMAFETELVDNKSRFDVTKSAVRRNLLPTLTLTSRSDVQAIVGLALLTMNPVTKACLDYNLNPV